MEFQELSFCRRITKSLVSSISAVERMHEPTDQRVCSGEFFPLLLSMLTSRPLKSLITGSMCHQASIVRRSSPRNSRDSFLKHRVSAVDARLINLNIVLVTGKNRKVFIKSTLFDTDQNFTPQAVKRPVEQFKDIRKLLEINGICAHTKDGANGCALLTHR